MKLLLRISRESYEYAERVADLSSKFYSKNEPVEVIVEGGLVLLTPKEDGWECSAEIE